MSDWPLIIEPEDLEPRLGEANLLLVDLSNPEHYQQGHIPGAVHVHPRETQLGTPPAPGKLPDEASLQRLVSRIGLNPESHVVAYDDEGGGWAGRFLWLLDCIGHDRYSFLNGGLVAWSQEGHPLTTEVPEPEPGQLQVRIQDQPNASMDEVLEAVEQGRHVIWDARSPAEFRGERQTASRNGHIPGAVNLEWTQLMDPTRNFRLKPEGKLRELLEKSGIEPGCPVITHCQSHHRSGLSYLVAKALDYPAVRGYAGSWSEWGNHPDTPVE